MPEQQPASPQPWRESPFEHGQRYRVLMDFDSLRDHFRAGEVLVYDHDTYSRYDNCTAYIFTRPGSTLVRCWDLYDDDDLSMWEMLFQPLPGE